MTRAKQVIGEVLLYIQDNAANTPDITLQSLCERFKVERFSLSREINACVGNLNDFVNTVRIAHAKTLLNKNKFSAKEVALNSGFGSISQFNRIFKRFTGTTCGEYQKKEVIDNSEKIKNLLNLLRQEIFSETV